MLRVFKTRSKTPQEFAYLWLCSWRRGARWRRKSWHQQLRWFLGAAWQCQETPRHRHRLELQKWMMKEKINHRIHREFQSKWRQNNSINIRQFQLRVTHENVSHESKWNINHTLRKCVSVTRKNNCFPWTNKTHLFRYRFNARTNKKHDPRSIHRMQTRLHIHAKFVWNPPNKSALHLSARQWRSSTSSWTAA